MVQQVHGHIVSELGHSSRTDTIFHHGDFLQSHRAGHQLGDSGNQQPWLYSGLSPTDIVLNVFVTLTLLVNAIAA